MGQRRIGVTERSIIMGFYDDPRYGVVQSMVLAKKADGTIGSANSTRGELERRTLLKNITVKDWNLEVLTGATCTGTSQVTTQIYQLAIGKSVDGTGSISTIGTAAVGTAGAADNTVIDASCTETDFDAGDDIIFSVEVGTALGDNSLAARANVSYVERFVA
jgi:hypothetical protein